jgi:pyrroloquinoline quinone biosynthesis protein D
MDGEGVLYCYEKATMVYLNESAIVVWRLCDGQRTVGEIVGLLANAYPDAADKVRSDVSELVEHFVQEGVLEMGEA